jgi:FAD-dependent oxidoreductase domain-containing protein 1
MKKSYDVVIVGGGVVGSAIAYFLTRNPDFKGTVAVIERDPSYTTASSSLSSSGIRQQYGTAPNIQMSAWSMEFLRSSIKHLSVEDHVADIGFHENGYLILGGANKYDWLLARNEIQRREGVAVDLIFPAALADRFPFMRTSDIAIASLGTKDEGWFDGPGLHQAFKRRARSLGADYIDATVTGFEVAPSGISSVKIGVERILCGTVVNAAGAWSGRVAAYAGVKLPVVPRKRCVFVVETPAKVPFFMHDTSGFWIRPEGRLYICSTTPEIENSPDDYSLDVDYALFDEVIWPALAHRVPAFEQLRLLSAWAGLYDYNLFDHSAILGKVPAVPNFIMANGFSGHGMMHSPATGLSVSEIIIYGKAATIDIEPFNFARIAALQPLREHVY